MNAVVDEHMRLEHMPYTLADFDSLADGWYKVVFAGEAAEVNMLSALVDKSIPLDERFRRCTFVRSSDSCFEMVPPNVNKGSGLRKLAEILKTPMSDTVAIGDYYNDIAMLDAAGYSAAVADAPAEVRAFADVSVKACLMGGVAELLESLDSLCAGYEQMKFELDAEAEE
ncbi:MAG: HAD hydrolase family protein [Oscillospiraceae bacterium]|nr:HAD hydrolase family protein [Oscillospiraceae bacterium]